MSQAGNKGSGGSGGNDLHAARYIVSAGGLTDGANYTTIGAAITAAVAAGGNQTIFLQPGTYTEDITLNPGINLTAFDCDALTPNVIILGECTFTASGTVSCSGIQFQTNSNYAISITGSNTNSLFLENCFLNASDNTGINCSNSNSQVHVINSFSINSPGIPIFSITGTAGFEFDNCRLSQSDGTASEISSGQVSFYNCTVGIPLNTSSAGFGYYRNTLIQPVANTTALVTSGTGNIIITNCDVETGSATAITIGSGSIVSIASCNVKSSAAEAINGSGTINYGGVVFTGTSSVINVSTENPIPWPVDQGGTGISSATAYAPICGGTISTGNFQSADTGIGTAGFVLTSNGSSLLPSFQASAFVGSSTAFSAYLSSTQSNVTGDGTIYPVIFDTVISNIGSAYNATTGVFTAPATGVYQFSYIMVYVNPATSSAFIEAFTSGSPENYNFRATQASAANVVSTTLIQNGSITVPLTAGNTMQINASAFGGTLTVGIGGGTLSTFATTSIFSGSRIA